MSAPTIQHPYLRDGWSPTVRGPLEVGAPLLGDVNPADEVVRRMRGRNFGGSGGGLKGLDGIGKDGKEGEAGADGASGSSSTSAINQLKTQLAALEARINGISAVCNGDGTITITI